MRLVRTLVLPEPAPATTSSGPPSWTTASCCWGLRPRRILSIREPPGSRIGGLAPVRAPSRPAPSAPRPPASLAALSRILARSRSIVA